MTPDSHEDQDDELTKAIEDHLMSDDNLAFDPRIFSILDNLNSSENEIASIEKMIDRQISLRLRCIANSVHYGMIPRGKDTTFSNVIRTLGMHPTKHFIIALALFTKLGAEHRQIELESFATAWFAKLIAETMGVTQAGAERAEIAGLFLNIGKLVIALYGVERQVCIEPSYIETHHRYFAVKMIEKFNLPEFLESIVTEERLVLHKNSFSIRGIVYLAQSLVERMIRECGLIEIKSPMPDFKDNLDITLGLIIKDYFNLIGMGKFVKVISY